MEIKERVYTLKNCNDSMFLNRNDDTLGCPHKYDPETFVTCGEWCPAFQIDKITNNTFVHLKCFPQPVTYKIKEV